MPRTSIVCHACFQLVVMYWNSDYYYFGVGAIGSVEAAFVSLVLNCHSRVGVVSFFLAISRVLISNVLIMFCVHHLRKAFSPYISRSAIVLTCTVQALSAGVKHLQQSSDYMKCTLENRSSPPTVGPEEKNCFLYYSCIARRVLSDCRITAVLHEKPLIQPGYANT